MADLSIRGLDDEVRERIRLRAARHGRSMEAEIRVILTDAVRVAEAPQVLRWPPCRSGSPNWAASNLTSHPGRLRPAGRSALVIVVDTNVVSESMRPSPSAAVTSWLDDQFPGDLYTTAVTVAEIRYGIERLPDGQRRDQLLVAATEVLAGFAERVLPFDTSAAVRYGAIVAGGERAGAPITGFDAQIAAICLVRGATLATRNTKHFDGTGVAVVNPWASP